MQGSLRLLNLLKYEVGVHLIILTLLSLCNLGHVTAQHVTADQPLRVTADLAVTADIPLLVPDRSLPVTADRPLVVPDRSLQVTADPALSPTIDPLLEVTADKPLVVPGRSPQQTADPPLAATADISIVIPGKSFQVTAEPSPAVTADPALEVTADRPLPVTGNILLNVTADRPLVIPGTPPQVTAEHPLSVTADPSLRSTADFPLGGPGDPPSNITADPPFLTVDTSRAATADPPLSVTHSTVSLNTTAQETLLPKSMNISESPMDNTTSPTTKMALVENATMLTSGGSTESSTLAFNMTFTLANMTSTSGLPSLSTATLNTSTLEINGTQYASNMTTTVATMNDTMVTQAVTSPTVAVTSLPTSNITDTAVSGGIIDKVSAIISTLTASPTTGTPPADTSTFSTAILTTQMTTTPMTTPLTTPITTSLSTMTSTVIESTSELVQTTFRTSSRVVNDTVVTPESVTTGLASFTTTAGNVTSLPPLDGSGIDLWLIVIGASAGVLVILLILLLICCVRKRRHDREKKKRYLRDDENVLDYAYHPRRPTNSTIREGSVKNGVGLRHSGFHDNPVTTPDEEDDAIDATTKPAVRNYFHDGIRANETLDFNTSEEPDSLERQSAGLFNKNDVVRRENKPSFPMRALSAKSRISMGPIMLGELDPETQPSTQKTYDKMYSGHSTFRK